MTKGLLSGIVLGAIVILMSAHALGDPILFMDFYNPTPAQVPAQWSASAAPVGVCYANTENAAGRTNQNCALLDVQNNVLRPTCWVQSPMMVSVINDQFADTRAMTSTFWIMFPDTNQYDVCLYWDGMIYLGIRYENNAWKPYYRSVAGQANQYIVQNLGLAINQWYEFSMKRAVGGASFTFWLDGVQKGGQCNCWLNGAMRTSVWMGIQVNTGQYCKYYLDDIYVYPNTNANYWLFEDFEHCCGQAIIHGWGVTTTNGGSFTPDLNGLHAWNRENWGIHVCAPPQQGQSGYAWVTTKNCPLAQTNYMIGIDVKPKTNALFDHFYVLCNGEVHLFLMGGGPGVPISLWAEQGPGDPDMWVANLNAQWNYIFCMVALCPLFPPFTYDVYVNYDPDQPQPRVAGLSIYGDPTCQFVQFGDKMWLNQDPWYGEANFDNVRIVQNW